MTTTRRQHGFTLIELTMVILITGIIMVIVTRMYATGVSSVITSQHVNDATWQGRITMERMVREIRSTRSAADISVMTASGYTFTDMNGNSIAYSLSGSNLMRNANILASGINSLTFAYYDEDGISTASSTSVEYVTITINVTQYSSNYSLTSSVYLRDLSS